MENNTKRIKTTTDTLNSIDSRVSQRYNIIIKDINDKYVQLLKVHAQNMPMLIALQTKRVNLIEDVLKYKHECLKYLPLLSPDAIAELDKKLEKPELLDEFECAKSEMIQLIFNNTYLYFESSNSSEMGDLRAFNTIYPSRDELKVISVKGLLTTKTALAIECLQHDNFLIVSRGETLSLKIIDSKGRCLIAEPPYSAALLRNDSVDYRLCVHKSHIVYSSYNNSNGTNHFIRVYDERLVCKTALNNTCNQTRQVLATDTYILNLTCLDFVYVYNWKLELLSVLDLISDDERNSCESVIKSIGLSGNRIFFKKKDTIYSREIFEDATEKLVVCESGDEFVVRDRVLITRAKSLFKFYDAMSGEFLFRVLVDKRLEHMPCRLNSRNQLVFYNPEEMLIYVL